MNSCTDFLFNQLARFVVQLLRACPIWRNLHWLLDENDEVVYADSAYVGRKLPEHIENMVCEKGFRGKALTSEQKESNRIKSKTRCRVEHVFGFMTVSMHGLTVRSVGMKRAEFNIGLTNLVYNICRYTFLERKRCIAG